MRQITRLFVILGAGLALSGMTLGVAWAGDDINNASATNVQNGDNENETTQTGNAGSGDAVAGSVAGVVSSGDVSIDATNRSEDVDVETGDATGTNDAAAFVGMTAGTQTAVVSGADLLNDSAVNLLEGDNSYDLSQDATATSGDGVGGQVIGVVSTRGGDVDMVAANTSKDADIETGDADASNDAAAFVGLNATGTVVTVADINNASATNVQEGDNELSATQDADSASGDGVGGQVIGVVSAGRDPIDASNRSEDVDVETGDAAATNDFASFVGLTAGTATPVVAADLLNDNAVNLLEGDNSRDLMQSADAASGDAVAGQIAGVVSQSGGSADLVLANTSLDSSAESGDGDFSNTDESFTGLNADGLISIL
jgi:hypothetical protein